jgi:hypothetical protein
VRALRRAGGIDTAHLGQHPVVRGGEALHVLLGTTSLQSQLRK